MILALLGSRVMGAGPRLVLTSFQPLYSLAWEVARGSPGLRVENLAPPDLGPHDFDVTDPALARRYRAATALVTLRRLHLAASFDQLYPAGRRHNIYLVELDPLQTWTPGASAMRFLPNPRDGRRHPGAAPPGDGWNPHVWLSLSHAARMGESLAGDFAALDPGQADRYRGNAASLARRLLGLRDRTLARLAPLEAPELVSLTEGFPYLTADLDLPVLDYVLAPADATEVEQRVRAAGVRVVLAEQPPAADVLRAVARAGARLVVLDTIERGTAGRAGGLDPRGYELAMRRNLDRLYRALAAEPMGSVSSSRSAPRTSSSTP